MWASAHSRLRRTSSTTMSRSARARAQVGEGGAAAGSPAVRPPAHSLRGPPVAAAVGPFDPDPDQLALRLGHLFGRLAEQRERGAPRDHPAEVGGERPSRPKFSGAGDVPGGERGAGAQVDHPLAGRRSGGAARRSRPAPAATGRARPSARSGSPAPCGRSTPGRRPARRAGRRRALLVQGQRRVGLLLVADRRGGRPRPASPSRSCRTRGSGTPPRSSGQLRSPAGARSGTARAPVRACGPAPSRSGRPVEP